MTLTTTNIESLQVEERLFPPPPEFAKNAIISSAEQL